MCWHTGLSQDDYGGEIAFQEFNHFKQAAAIEDPQRQADEIKKLGLRQNAFEKLLHAIRTAGEDNATHI